MFCLPCQSSNAWSDCVLVQGLFHQSNQAKTIQPIELSCKNNISITIKSFPATVPEPSSKYQIKDATQRRWGVSTNSKYQAAAVISQATGVFLLPNVNVRRGPVRTNKGTTNKITRVHVLAIATIKRKSATFNLKIRGSSQSFTIKAQSHTLPN